MSKEYFVAEGKSIVTAVGMKGPGAKVSEKDFSSPEVFENLINSSKNLLVEKEPVSKVDVKKAPEPEPVKDDKKAKKEEKEPEPVKDDEKAEAEGKDLGASKK